MPVRHWPAVFLLTLLALAAGSGYRSATVSASMGFRPVAPEELSMKNEPQAPGAPAIVLYRQVVRDDNSPDFHEDNYFRIKIFTRRSENKNADIEIPFFKGSGNIGNIRARTIRPDGSIVNFDGKVFEKPIAKARGIKYMAKTFTLPEVEPGSVIEYSYTENMRRDSVFRLALDPE